MLEQYRVLCDLNRAIINGTSDMEHRQRVAVVSLDLNRLPRHTTVGPFGKCLRVIWVVSDVLLRLCLNQGRNRKKYA